MKNHFLWDFLTKYKEKGSYRDSFTWSMESIRWIPYVFGLRLNLIIFSSTVLVLYAQFWGWVNVFYGVWPWKLSFVGDFKGFILAGIWMATSGFALLIVCIFCFVLTIDSKVAEIAKEFIEAKKNRWCPEIEIV